MDAWIHVIIEWVNCLGICKHPISHIQQLQDRKIFYSKFIRKLRHSDSHHQIINDDDNDELYKFIENEYPEFVITKNDDIDNVQEQVYLSSLLLLSASQKVSFHCPMYTLKNETQILIKRFLEIVLPYGKNVTVDTIRDTILELTDETPITPPQTPNDRPLKNFLTSPAAHSAYRHKMLNERTRELRLLRAQLETERFEKVDLQEDIQSMEAKIVNLQTKLQSKTDEVKALRAERSLPITPQSARKNKKKGNIEEFLRKEVEHLELFNAKLQENLDRLEVDHENVIRRLASTERVSSTLKQKVDEFEREMETLSIQLELKTNESLDLRMQNEELRAHFKEMQRNQIDTEQSFEVEQISRARSPIPELNISEVASSIIDIQLREAREESTKHKMEVNSLQQKLEIALNECTELKCHNELLNEKISILSEVQVTLEITEDKLSKRECQLNIVQMEKQRLEDEIKKLQDIIHDKEVTLKNAETKKSEMESEISNLKYELNNVKISLVTTEDTMAQITTSKEVLNMKLIQSEEKVNALEKSLVAKTSECIEQTQMSQEKICELEQKLLTCSNERQRLEENLIQKNNDLQQFTNDLAKKNSEVNSLQSNVTQLKNQLISNQSSLVETESKLCELNELRDELQAQLLQESKNSAVLYEKTSELERNLSALESVNTKLTDKLSIVQLNLNELQQECDDLRNTVIHNKDEFSKEKMKADLLHSEKENLMAQLDIANTEICQLKNIQQNLENRLTQEQESCMKLVTEKAELEHNIAINKRQNIDDSDKISTLQSIIDKSHEELTKIHDKYNECNANYVEANDQIQCLTMNLEKSNSEIDILNKKILELEQTGIHLKTKLESAQSNAEKLLLEKDTLEIAILSRDDDKKKLKKQISVLEADLDESRSNIEKLNTDHVNLHKKYETDAKTITVLSKKMEVLDSNYKKMTHERDSLQTKVNDLEKETQIRDTKIKELHGEIEELHQTKKRMLESHQDHQNASSELTASLEKRLLATQNACETLKLDITMREESLAMLKSKLKDVTNERNDSEQKMKEVITGLQEVRSSQEALLKTQLQALNEKTSEYDTLKIQYLKMKDELETQINLQKVCIEDLSKQCLIMKQTIDKNAEEIQKLEGIKNQENCQLKEYEEKCELLEADMKTIENICRVLLDEDSQQNAIIDNEIIFNNLTTNKLVEMFKNICAKAQTTNQIISQLQNENKYLKKISDEYKSMNATVQAEEKKYNELLDKFNSIDVEWNKRKIFVADLIRKKEQFQILLTTATNSRNELEDKLLRLRHLWNVTLYEVKNNISTNTSACDELKHMEAMKLEIEQLLNDLDERYTSNSKPLLKVLCQVFMWSGTKINELYTAPLTKVQVNISDDDLSDEVSVLEAEIKTNETMQNDVIVIKDKIDELRNISNSYETNIKSGIIKREVTVDDKMQIELDKVLKEKKELKDKMDSMRVRNVKLEKNIDDLRSENKKMKAELLETSSKSNIECDQLRSQIEQLSKELEQLKVEKVELEKRPKEEDFDIRLKDIHNEYDQKLEKLKQKMKTAYSEQIAKVNVEQEKAMAEKVASMHAKLEQQCKKYSEDIAKYKAHISDMSAQFWDIGEKLLAEKQEKETALQRLRGLQGKHSNTIIDANSSTQLTSTHNPITSVNNERDYNNDRKNIPTRSSFRAVQVVEEETTTTTRRHSVKSIQAMGNPFNAEDEEGEVFDNVYLADLKEGRFRGVDRAHDLDRMSELRMRNSLCKPHLKSSYAVETHFHPLGLTEDDIKSGPPNDDTFNDSLSQSLLPGQKTKKKDRTQTSYKRPGPPTPSKNGGRLSLQGNELKSPNSRILRERNSERRTTATPKRLKDFFATSLSRRQDENAPSTPRGRRLSNIFRKTRLPDKS